MRIGIITIHFVPNYGAILQAYALSTYLRKNGVDASIIDYRQPDLERYFRMSWRIPPAVRHWWKLRKCARFVNEKLPLTRRQYHSVGEFQRDAGKFDAFITGSDQVWFTGPVQNYDPMYFLDFAAKRKISYAASVGGIESFGEFRERAGRSLSEYSHVGVRDAHTASLVAPLAPQGFTETVDPTFLHDFEELVSPRPPHPRPYVLVFGNFSGDLENAVRDVRQRTGIEDVVTLGYPCAAATRRIPSPDPMEWVNWFRHASFVMTSYFHGTAFAVNFHRPFISIPTPGRRRKVETLLEPLGLGGRCFAPKEVHLAPSVANVPINWSFVDDVQNERIAVSRNFLNEALD